VNIDQAIRAIVKKLEEHPSVELIAVWISTIRNERTTLVPIWIRVILDQKNEMNLFNVESLAQEIKKEFNMIKINFLINVLPFEEISEGVPKNFRIFFRKK